MKNCSKQRETLGKKVVFTTMMKAKVKLDTMLIKGTIRRDGSGQN